MALLDSAHRVSTVRHDRTERNGGIHPSICLAGGFGFIIATAMIVHVAMAALF